ncbi:DUF3592 domain-containing protein [Streptomyces sp. NPDC048111]|uniref:DUF3592 domain-containing protein n=1 Tax=Streptomyces sp. NPDC048111 TaxID=3365500 RepID=UPI003721CB83
MERAWLFSLIPLTIGVIHLCFGVYGLRRARAIRCTGVTATGRVVRHDVRRTDEGARYYHPVAAWATEDGQACEYPSSFGRNAPGTRFRLGATVTVRYDPADPRRFAIQGWDTATIHRVFTAVGAVLTAGTVAALLIGLLVA